MSHYFVAPHDVLIMCEGFLKKMSFSKPKHVFHYYIQCPTLHMCSNLARLSFLSLVVGLILSREKMFHIQRDPVLCALSHVQSIIINDGVTS